VSAHLLSACLPKLTASPTLREYPKNDAEAVNYVELLRDLRQGLDRHTQKKGRSTEQGYELTIAAVSVDSPRLGEEGKS
jgi:GH18 family chitinase